MEKVKAVLEILQEKNDHWSDLYGDQLAACVRMLEAGIAELEQPKTGISGVRQVSIGGNCVQSVIVTGEGNKSE